MKTETSTASTLTPTRHRRTMARATGFALGLTAAAAVALGATPAQAAPCSEDTQTIVNLAATATSLIPKIGSLASAGIGLGGTLFCDANEPLNVQDVLNIVQAEFESQAFAQVQTDLQLAQNNMEAMAIKLQQPGFGQSDFESLDPALADELVGDARNYANVIRRAEGAFKATMANHFHGRTSYDLSAAVVLANYKLTLVQIATAAAPNDPLAEALATDVAEEILLDIPEYRLEADKLREMTPVAKDGLFLIDRGGLKVNGLERGSRQSAIRFSIIPFFEELDAQEAQFSWLEDRALALLDDPFVDLSTVQATVPRTPIMLKSLSDANRCVQNRFGRFRHDGVLREGATRQRDCDPALSSQLWYLEDNGQIKSNHAPVCLTAQTDSQGTVLVEECTGDDEGNGANEKQVWTRRGDTFEVEIDGVTSCLENPRNFGKTLRHKPCKSNDSNRVQQWHVYGPMKNGRPPQLPDVDPATLSIEDIQAISEQFDARFNQCAERPITGVVSLEDCERYTTDHLWAHNSLGLLVPLREGSTVVPISDSILKSTGEVDPDGFLRIRSTPDNFSETGEVIPFERNPEADGTVTFTREDDGRLLLPSARTAPNGIVRSLLVAGVEQPDENGDLPDSHFWQHPNGGKFAE